MKENCTWVKWGKMMVVHKMVLAMVMGVALIEGNKLTSRNNCWHFSPGYWIVPYGQWNEGNANIA
jgi:hypothetical protein